MGFSSLSPLFGPTCSPLPLNRPFPEIDGTGIRFSHEMPKEHVAKCFQHYHTNLTDKKKRNFANLKDNGAASEGVFALNKSLRSAYAGFAGNAISYAGTVSDQLKPMYEKNYRLAQELKPQLQDIARFKGTPGARYKVNDAMRRLQPKLFESNDSVNKTTDMIYSQKLSSISSTLMNREQAGNMARKGILVENLNDFNTIVNGYGLTRSIGYGAFGVLAYNNYTQAINNIGRGRNEQDQLFYANSKTTFSWVGASLGADATVAVSVALAPETGGLSLIILAVSGAVVGSGFGDFLAKGVNKFYDLF